MVFSKLLTDLRIINNFSCGFTIFLFHSSQLYDCFISIKVRYKSCSFNQQSQEHESMAQLTVTNLLQPWSRIFPGRIGGTIRIFDEVLPAPIALPTAEQALLVSTARGIGSVGLGSSWLTFISGSWSKVGRMFAITQTEQVNLLVHLEEMCPFPKHPKQRFHFFANSNFSLKFCFLEKQTRT